MIVDTSAIVAMALREPGHVALADALGSAEVAGVGAPTLVETGMVMTSREGARGYHAMEAILREQSIAVIPFDDGHWRAAVAAFSRFGKGRHAAGLSFGDCLSYATARQAGRPLLCLGNDFAQTDLDLVPLT